MDKLRNKILSMPDTAGVYLMKDAAGKVIYVGKANSLKKRLRSYISRDMSSKTVALMSHVADIKFELCPTESLALLREARSFPFRSCKKLPKKACIYYRLGLSPAPCTGKISRRAYTKIIDDIALILEGKAESLIKRLSSQMQKKSRELKYEEAARLRDQILALNDISAGQTNY
ncbi:MAG: GIY-YIG nuclease family protein, partial [Candidatus Wolfebacteria bacterium]|nr:GIY-YIG nuclease family protein [Candidatus Wolfebacteria bacterium]